MAEITYLPIERLHPHPDNPRKDLGDLSELAASIKENGVFQNLTVVDDDPTDYYSDYTVIIGHRRLAAAKLAGLKELPCAIVEMTPKEQVQTMLLENMQRADLTVYEQAQGFQLMLDLGATIEEIAEKSGFSEKTVRRRVKMMELDQKILKEVSGRQLSLGDFDELAKIEDIKKRNEALSKIGTNDFDMAVTRAIKDQLVRKNTPKVKEWLKEHKAKKIKSSDSWSNKYESISSWIRIAQWDDEIRDLKMPEPLFYVWDSPDSLRLFKQRKVEKPVKKSQEEIDREKAIGIAWKALEESSAIALELRQKFIAGLTVTAKNKNAVLMGALYAGAYSASEYNSPDRQALYEILGVDYKNTWGAQRRKDIFKGLGEMKDKDLAKIVYAIWGDDASMLCVESGYRSDFPKYEINVKLNLIYNWLMTLGYELSTEENAILYGSHEAYHAGEKHDA